MIIALKSYEPRVSIYTDKLLQRVEANLGMPFDASLWFNFYSFDVMGDLSFGKSFNMLGNGIVHYYMKSLHDFMQLLGAIGHVMWVFQIFKRTPLVNAEEKKSKAWVQKQVTERMQNDPEYPDVFRSVFRV